TGDSRRVVEGIIYSYRTGIPCRDLPDRYSTCQTVWKPQRLYATCGHCDRVFALILTEDDAVGDIGRNMLIEEQTNPSHMHGTNLPRPDQDTGGSNELQESAVMRD